MSEGELVFIPPTAFSHIVTAVETAKLLLKRAERLSITVIIMNPTKDIIIETYTEKASSSTPRLRFINLPAPNTPPTPSFAFLLEYVESRVAHVLALLSHLIQQNPSSQILGLVLDFFTTDFISAAHQLGLPSYVFSPCGACYLAISRHITLQNKYQSYSNPDCNLSIPYFSLPVPPKVLPGWNLHMEDPTIKFILKSLKRLSEVKGIVVNTFYDLEPYTIDALQINQSDSITPKIYPVGPILKSSSHGEGEEEVDDDVKKWLDDQDDFSVVYLCFGSLGSLEECQVREIALALENCGCPFLWSLRNPRGLPEGFVERNKEIGKVIGWAAQVAILAHTAVGGFVSHCGWNSTLESLWYGVPIAAFPMFGDQHLNAFCLVKEVGVAEAITLDYRMDFTGEKKPTLVEWEEIAAVLRRMMAAGGSGVREKAKEMQKKARAAMVEGGSSYNSLHLFIDDVITNTP